MDNLVEVIKRSLNKGLPGTEVQWKMASSDRMVLDYPRKRKSGSKLGAVLILIYPVGDKYCTVFIQRPDYDGVHGGQIGFPGGKMESKDSTLTETALREACEETGICKDDLNLLGHLTPLYIPVSDIEVTPIIACLDDIPEFRINRQEVVYLIEADLSRFLDPSIIKERAMEVRGNIMNVKYFDYEDHIIWGATAMMLYELLVIAEREGINFQV